MINLNSFEDIKFTLFFSSYIGFLLTGKTKILNQCKAILQKEFTRKFCQEGKFISVLDENKEKVKIYPQHIEIDFENYECILKIRGVKEDLTEGFYINNIEDIEEN